MEYLKFNKWFSKAATATVATTLLLGGGVQALPRKMMHLISKQTMHLRKLRVMTC